MATTRLISKSLGDINLQNGSGTPDHTGSTSNLYFDSNSVGTYKLNPLYSGSVVTTAWEKIRCNESVSIMSTASTTINTTSTTTWYTMSGSSYGWVNEYSNGFFVESGRVTLTGSSGDYYINATVTLDYNATLANFRVGLSKNVSVPSTGFYTSSTLWVTGQQYQATNLTGVVSLVSGDTLELAFNSPQTANSTIDISGATLALNKIL